MNFALRHQSILILYPEVVKAGRTEPRGFLCRNAVLTDSGACGNKVHFAFQKAKQKEHFLQMPNIPWKVRDQIVGFFSSRSRISPDFVYYKEFVEIIAKNCHELSDITASDKVCFIFRQRKLYARIRDEYVSVSLAKSHTNRLTIKQRLYSVPPEFWGEEWLE